MNILLIDTCLDKTYLTISHNDITNSLILENNGNDYHTSHIHSNIIKLCKISGVTLQDINMLVTDIGPGSFTGIKVGLTVVKTLAQGLNIDILPINSLELLVKAYQKECAALDARKGKCYFIHSTEGPMLIDWEELENYQNKSFVCDKKIYDYLTPKGIDSINYEEKNVKLSEIMLSFIDKKEVVNWANLRPLYIQPPPIHKK